LLRGGEPLGVVQLPVPGRHNAVNAAGAAAIALELGAPFEAVTRALGGFAGVARRFQFRGERDGVTYVDDYAHLPSDVDAMIRAAREGGWDRVVAVFQPHRYTRTAALWRDFADAFEGADALVLTDVYPAGEQPQPGVSGRLVLRAVLDAHPDQSVTYLPRRADLVAHVPRLARPGDVVLTLGAGDLTTAPDEWLAPRP
jgi:UDP-N-acetylmuramate--alanine ligase